MNKIIVVLILVVALGLGAVIFIPNQRPQKSSEEKKIEKSSVDQVDSRYLVYSKNLFDQSAEKRRVLYFYANWCPICKPADEDFKANSEKIPEDVILIRVNYNDSDTDQEEKDLAKKYGITYQHTFVQIDQESKEVVKWNGGAIEELLENLK